MVLSEPMPTYRSPYRDASLKNAVLECKQDCFGIIPLEGTDAFLKFKIFGDYLDYVMETDEEKRRQKWIESFSASEAYQLIKKGSWVNEALQNNQI